MIDSSNASVFACLRSFMKTVGCLHLAKQTETLKPVRQKRE